MAESASASARTRATARRLRLAVLPAFAVVGVLAGVVALDATGASAPTLLNDAGPVARLGLPAAEFVFNAAMSVTIAALVLATLVLPRMPARRVRHRDRAREDGQDSRDDELDPAWSAVLGIAEASSVVWTLSSVAVLVLTFVDTAGAQAYQGDFSAQLGQYATQVPYGQMWSFITLVVLVVSTLVFALRSHAGVAITAVLAFVPLVPQGLMGHSADAGGHMQAVNSIILHLVAVVLWMGGLLVLALLAPRLTEREDLGTIVARYSSLALFAWVLMVFSGLVNATLRVDSLADWMTPYGLVVITKIVLTVLLGVVGYWHRSFVIGRLGGPGQGSESGAEAGGGSGAGSGGDPANIAATGRARREFWRLLGVEALLFGAAMSLGVVLSRSRPPVPDDPPRTPTPAEILTQEPLPPPPSWSTYFTEWQIDPLWIVVAVGLSAAYVAGFVRLRRRGDAWPVHRLVLWIVGMAGLVYVTCGGPMVYGRVLFSGHMIQHMIIVMAIPVPLVLGAPITLLMRATTARRDGSRGLREWILLLVHSRYLRFWAHPIVAAVNFAGSLVVFYYSGIMGVVLATHVGHELMIVHFLAAGYMFAQSIIGIDPGVERFAYPVRLLLLLITMAFHAFFGVSIISSTSLIEGDWFGNIGHGWIPALEDQQRGGEIAWGTGEFPTLIMAIIVAVQWSRSSDREAKRRDRSEARTGDAELEAYNEMLANLNKP